MGPRFRHLLARFFLGTRARVCPYPFLGYPARLSHYHIVALDETETATEEESGGRDERPGGRRWPPISRSTPGLASPR